MHTYVACNVYGVFSQDTSQTVVANRYRSLKVSLLHFFYDLNAKQNKSTKVVKLKATTKSKQQQCQKS